MIWYVTGKQALTIHRYLRIFMLVSAFFTWKNYTNIPITKNYIIKEKKYEQSN